MLQRKRCFVRMWMIFGVVLMMFPWVFPGITGEEKHEIKSPSYGDGTPVVMSNPYTEKITTLRNETGKQSNPTPTSPPGLTPENNNWGQYMKDFYRSGRYLTAYDLFGGTNPYRLTSAAVRASPIMLHKEESGDSLCIPKINGDPVYYCTIIGDDSGWITAVITREILYSYRWQIQPQIISPISSFAASNSIESSSLFWVATKGGGQSVYPVLEVRRTYNGQKPCPDPSKCTIIFGTPNARIITPLLYLPGGGGGGIIEDRVYVVVEYPNTQQMTLYAYTLATPPAQIVLRWSRTFTLFSSPNLLALQRNNEPRPIIMSFPDAAGTIMMLSEVNGATLAYTQAGAPVVASPSIDTYTWGYLYVPAADGRIRKYDINIAYVFNLLWTSQDFTPTPKIKSIFSSIANHQSALYVAIHNGYNNYQYGRVKFLSINKNDGSVIWASQPILSYPSTLPAIYASPAVTLKYVFFVAMGPDDSNSGSWYELSISDGSIMHTRWGLDSGQYTETSTVISRVDAASDLAFALTGATNKAAGIGYQQ